MEQPAVLLTPDWEITREDIAWAAGLFEGEGCIRGTVKKKGNAVTPGITLAMTDQDAVIKFNECIGRLGVIYEVPPERTKLATKPIYYCRVYGFESVQAVMCFLWEWLCSRRRASFVDVMTKTLAGPRQRKYFEGDVCSIEGCGKPIKYNNLCMRHVHQDMVARWARSGVCGVTTCDRPLYVKGLCRTHYDGLRKKRYKGIIAGWRLEDGVIICD